MNTELLSIDSAASGFAAAGAPARLQVLRLLVRAGDQGLSTQIIQQRLQIPMSTLVHHLKHLVAGQLVEQTKQGRELISRANYSHIQLLVDFLTHECCIESE
ncbi:MAG: helix-turn-helix transcriptional regulator [Gammaproteobacteria bacterium]|jgi:DNA-binding transcriptional ArsR family regulator|nr:helix-turn-helix transcriptional regulator [Gammaproteobacteria bacterium]MCP4929252.1 helix-turn-helix transcriptional regulator [Gammaproteobacteria bacterium]MDP6166997.1 helix-turn-helix domain-containing protein [Gammaproteobacteria bacterium]